MNTSAEVGKIKIAACAAGTPINYSSASADVRSLEPASPPLTMTSIEIDVKVTHES